MAEIISNYHIDNQKLGRSLGYHIKHPNIVFCLTTDGTIGDYWVKFGNKKIGVVVHKNDTELPEGKVFSLAKGVLNYYVRQLNKIRYNDSSRDKTSV